MVLIRTFPSTAPCLQADWLNNIGVTNVLTVIRLTRRVWSSDWVTDNDSVMSDDGESDE